MVIRPVVAEDLPAITAIYGHYVENGLASFETTAPSVAEMAQRYESILAAEHPYWICELEGELAGYGYASTYRPRDAYRYTLEDTVYVHPGSLGRGIGYAVLKTLIEDATERGFRQMLAIIGDGDHRGSIALHRKAGFRNVGLLRSVGYKFGRWVDTVVMQCDLGPGDRTLPASSEAAHDGQ